MEFVKEFPKCDKLLTELADLHSTYRLTSNEYYLIYIYIYTKLLTFSY